MREEYIKLIKEYVRLKPEYRHILNEIKANVLSVGATEKEFEQAIKEITGLPSPLIVLNQASVPEIETVKKNKYYKELQNKAISVWKILNGRFKRNRRWFTASLFSVIIATFFSFADFHLPPKMSNQIVQVSKKIVENKTKFPAVYANSMPIDAEKTFSFKPINNIKLTITNKPRREVLGFFPYWMLPIQERISLDTLTSISLFGIEIDGAGNIVTQNTEGVQDRGWIMWQSSELNSLIRRAKNQNIKIYLTLKSFSNENIASLSQNDEAQKKFISNALYLINSKNLDGINIDFEYTGEVNQEIRKGFTRLITNLNSELKRQIEKSDLTLDTFLISGSEKGIFDIPALSKQSDAFVIMGYDMHTPLSEPGPVSAMGGVTNIIGYLQGYLEKVPPEKLILAVPYYGYDWPENLNPDTKVKILPFAEILEMSLNIKLGWDETSQTPFFNYTENGVKRIVHFDNVRSLGIKYDFINKKNLKGVGIWALGYDGQNSDLQKLILDKFFN